MFEVLIFSEGIGENWGNSARIKDKIDQLSSMKIVEGEGGGQEPLQRVFIMASFHLSPGGVSKRR